MEENIKEIIYRNFCKSDGTHYESAAKEIAEHFERFNIWSIPNIEIRTLSGNFVHTETGRVFRTHKELYSYWLTNINKP